MLRAILVSSLLLVSLMAGCTDKLALNAASVDAPAFDLSPTEGGKTTVFKADARGLGEKNNVTWDWGDGTYSYGDVAEHKYGFTNGVMTVTLLVTSPDGKQGIATRTITLGSGVNQPPSVTGRTIGRNWTEVGKTINLSATGSDRDGDTLTYLWTYKVLSGGVASDGHAHDHGATPAAATAEEFVIDGAGNRVGTTFDAPGKYAVKVRARDPKGAEATNEFVVFVSKKIPSSTFEQAFEGKLVAGTGGAGASEKAWLDPAPDTNVDAARHRYTLLYPGYTLIFLAWNDTSTQLLYDLDLELRHAGNGTTVFKSETRAPAAPFEFNMSMQEPGDYEVIVRGVVGADFTYTALVRSSLQLTPELVAAVEGA